MLILLFMNKTILRDRALLESLIKQYGKKDILQYLKSKQKNLKIKKFN